MSRGEPSNPAGLAFPETQRMDEYPDTQPMDRYPDTQPMEEFEKSRPSTSDMNGRGSGNGGVASTGGQDSNDPRDENSEDEETQVVEDCCDNPVLVVEDEEMTLPMEMDSGLQIIGSELRCNAAPSIQSKSPSRSAFASTPNNSASTAPSSDKNVTSSVRAPAMQESMVSKFEYERLRSQPNCVKARPLTAEEAGNAALLASVVYPSKRIRSW